MSWYSRTRAGTSPRETSRTSCCRRSVRWTSATTSPSPSIPRPARTCSTRSTLPTHSRCRVSRSSRATAPSTHHRAADPQRSALRQLVEIGGQHPAPRAPIVLVVRSPWVDPVRDPFPAQDVGHPPRLTDVLPRTLTRREDGEAAPQYVEVRAVEAGHEVQRRGEVQIHAAVPTDEA